MNLFVKQSSKGAIIINKDISNVGKFNDVVIDGHTYSACIRVQSHYHRDHTEGFSESQLYHEILMSKATKDILGCQRNCQDIPYRTGIIGLDYDYIYEKNDYSIKLMNNGHVLGSSQIEISNDGYSVGYSGDFYDCSQIIKADHLIIDGSIGGLHKIRSFTREDSINSLRSLICQLAISQPIIIKAHSGLLEKIYFWISDIIEFVPRVADERFIKSLSIYSNYGYGYVSNIFDKDDKNSGFEILKSGEPCIRFVMYHEDVFNIENKILLNCSRFQDECKSPIIQNSSHSYYISLSDHADINGTLEYVSKINPTYISVDQIRIRNFAAANMLRNFIASELKIIPIKLDILPDEKF